MYIFTETLLLLVTNKCPPLPPRDFPPLTNSSNSCNNTNNNNNRREWCNQCGLPNTALLRLTEAPLT